MLLWILGQQEHLWEDTLDMFPILVDVSLVRTLHQLQAEVDGGGDERNDAIGRLTRVVDRKALDRRLQNLPDWTIELPAAGNTREGRSHLVQPVPDTLVKAAQRSPHRRLVFVTSDFSIALGRRFDWEFDVCRQASPSIARLAILFPLVRTAHEFSVGIAAVLEAAVECWGIGMIPESPSSVVDVAEFLSRGRAVLGEDRRLVLLLDLAALARGFRTEWSADSQVVPRSVVRSIETLLCQVPVTGRRVELGMSLHDVNLLGRSDAVFAIELSERLTFLVGDNGTPDN